MQPMVGRGAMSLRLAAGLGLMVAWATVVAMLPAWFGDALIAAGIAAGGAAILGLAAYALVQTGPRPVPAGCAQIGVSPELCPSDALRLPTLPDMLDQANVLISIKDTAGRYIFVNRALQRFSGLDAAAMIGQRVTDLMPGRPGLDVDEADRAVIDGRMPTQRELMTDSAAGPRSVLLSKFPIHGDTGEVSAVGTIMADLTVHKLADAQAAHALRMAAVAQLSGGIAHDFNNLLTVCIGQAELLIETARDRPDIQNAARAIMRSAERGADLTQRMLAYGRRQPLALQPVDLSSLLARLDPRLIRTLGPSVAVSRDMAADLWPVHGDPAQIEAAMLSLALNSRDAMPEGGRVTIEARNVTLGDSAATVNPEARAGDYVSVSVSDTGTGMAPDVMARAFEPFFTSKGVGKGTGLGLSALHGYVAQSGGHVAIESTVGQGTTVTLFLPRAETPPPGGLDDQSDKARDELDGTRRVLVVDDEDLVREYVRRALSGAGYAVSTAGSAAAALDLVDRDGPPDLLLSDIRLDGGMSGLELAAAILAEHPAVRVLHMSGYPGDDGDEGDPASQPVRLLGKPFRVQELIAAVRAALGQA